MRYVMFSLLALSIASAVAEDSSAPATRQVQPGREVRSGVALAPAFSRIWNVNGWSAQRLAEVGISVRAYKHALQSEDPPREWVQVTFDCSRLPKDQDVLLDAWLVSDAGEAAFVRAERKNQADDKISQIIAVQDKFLKNSRVEVYIWQKREDGGHEARGYSLSLRRIVELARQ